MSIIIFSSMNDFIAFITSTNRSLHTAVSPQPPVYLGAPA